MIAEERRELDAAKNWYLKALEIDERLGKEHAAAGTYGQLGILAGMRERYTESGQWLIRCVATFARQHDKAGVQRNVQNLMVFFGRATATEREGIKKLWEEAGLGPFPAPEDAGPKERHHRASSRAECSSTIGRMRTMRDAIDNLDDVTALRVLSSFAQANLRRGSFETELTPELHELLLGELGVTSVNRANHPS